MSSAYTYIYIGTPEYNVHTRGPLIKSAHCQFTTPGDADGPGRPVRDAIGEEGSAAAAAARELLYYKIYGIPRGIWLGDKPAERDGMSSSSRRRRRRAGGRGKPLSVGRTQKCNLEKPLMSNARAAAHKYRFLYNTAAREYSRVLWKRRRRRRRPVLRGRAPSFFRVLDIKKTPKYELRVFIIKRSGASSSVRTGGRRRPLTGLRPRASGGVYKYLNAFISYRNIHFEILPIYYFRFVTPVIYDIKIKYFTN